MPECDVTHCPEPGVQRIQHPRAPLEARWLCRDHLAGWLEVNPATPIAPATRRRLAHQDELKRIVPNPSRAVRADDIPLPMTPGHNSGPAHRPPSSTERTPMRLPTRSQRITLLAIRDANGELKQEQLAERLDITVKALAARLADFSQRSKQWVTVGQVGRKWDFVRLSSKGAALLNAALQAEAQGAGIQGRPSEIAAPSALPRSRQGQVTEDVIMDDPEPGPAEFAHSLAAVLGYDLNTADCPPWMDLLEEVDELRIAAASDEALSTRVHNQAQVIAALKRDLAAAKAATVDQAVLDELEELRRRSAETSDALEGVDEDPTTAQGRAVLKACQERDEAVAEVGRLTRAVARCELEVALYRQVRDVLSGRTLPDLAEGTVPAQVKALVQRVAELRDAEQRAWERGRSSMKTDIFEKLRWYLDPADAQNYTGEGLLEQVRLLRAAADAITPYVLEAEEDAIYLRAGHPRFGLRIMLASWDEVGAQGGYVHLYDWDGPSHHSVPVDCPEMGKAVALGLLAARGIEVPEALFTAPMEAEAFGGDEEVACVG